MTLLPPGRHVKVLRLNCGQSTLPVASFNSLRNTAHGGALTGGG